MKREYVLVVNKLTCDGSRFLNYRETFKYEYEALQRMKEVHSRSCYSCSYELYYTNRHGNKVVVKEIYDRR